MLKRLRAVALIVANPAGEILMLRERRGKKEIDKPENSDSIPMETCEALNEHHHSALVRLHTEELSGLTSVHVPGRYIGVYRVVPGVWVSLYATMSSSYVLPVEAGDQPEVDNYRWMSLQDVLALETLRRGAYEMVRDFAGGLEGVVQTYCVRPRTLIRA